MQEFLNKIVHNEDLTVAEAAEVMDQFTSGTVSPVYMAGILTALRVKGETPAEITGFAQVMREKSTHISKPKGQNVIDIVGTGGDRSGTFNISTLSAIVAAGAGLTVAKHGNRSITSKCGSADVLAALGVNLSAGPEILNRALQDVGLAFLFAPGLHPAMKHVMPVRRELGVRTVFNILGPISNPADADMQLVGVFEAGLTDIFAEVLKNLGMARAMIVHGYDGIDELTLTAKTRISELNQGSIHSYDFDPQEYGFNLCDSNDLLGGDADKNKQIALAILNGEQGPRRDVVVLNAGVAIYLAREDLILADAFQKARQAIDNGSALAKLEQLVKISNS